MIDFTVMSAFTLTALILAITITAITLSGVFFLMFKRKGIKNKFFKYMFLLVLPFVIFSLWSLAFLSVIKPIRDDETLAIIIGLSSGVCITAIVWGFSKAIEFLITRNRLFRKSNQEQLIFEAEKVNFELDNLKNIIDSIIENPIPNQKNDNLLDTNEVINEDKAVENEEIITESSVDIKNEETTSTTTEKIEIKETKIIETTIESVPVQESLFIETEEKVINETETNEEPEVVEDNSNNVTIDELTDNQTEMIEEVAEDISEDEIQQKTNELWKEIEEEDSNSESLENENVDNNDEQEEAIEGNFLDDLFDDDVEETENDESDFIKSLNEILAQLEKDKKNNKSE